MVSCLRLRPGTYRRGCAITPVGRVHLFDYAMGYYLWMGFTRGPVQPLSTDRQLPG